jgi:hypothetical protein
MTKKEIRAALIALERRGLVERFRRPNGEIAWRATNRQPDAPAFQDAGFDKRDQSPDGAPRKTTLQ